MRYVIADIEATGLDQDREMIEIALITLEDDRIVDVFETLINPLRVTPQAILDLTGITKRELEAAPKFYEVAEQIHRRLEGNVFVSHNVEFDFSMLSHAFTQMGRSLKCKTLCTLKLSQDLIPGLKSYTLEELGKFFGIKNKQPHRAYPDAACALELFRELRELATPKGSRTTPRYLPQHEEVFKKLSRRAGVLYFKDATGVAFKILATHDLLAEAMQQLEVTPENRELLMRVQKVDFELTGSELMARFKTARFERVTFKWMITVEQDLLGEKFFHLKPFVRDEGHWFFSERKEAELFLKGLKERLKTERLVWREGGKTKQEVMEHNRRVEEIVSETRFPCDNLLLWGPGRVSDEWSYVLVRMGKLIGFGFDTRAPEEVLKSPESAVQKRSDKQLEALTVRYLREHRERKIKIEQWRELKDLT